MLRRLPLLSLTCSVPQIGQRTSILSSSLRRMFSTKVEKCADVAAAGYDAVVVVAPNVAAAPEAVS